MTQQVIDAFYRADIIIGAERLLETFADFLKKKESSKSRQFFPEYRAERISEIIEKNSNRNCLILVSGDTGIYSGAFKIAEILRKYNPTLLPGISSPSYFCALLGVNLHNTTVVSAHGRSLNIVSEVRRNPGTIVLTGGNTGSLLSKLAEYGYGDLGVSIGENLSYSDERIISGSVSELARGTYAALSLMFIRNPEAESSVQSGINDDLFERASVPMTKSEVRSIIISRLKISPEDIVFDIGAGTGSVSAEAALAAYRGTVYAVERSKEGAELIDRNAHILKTDNITVINGEAPYALKALPAPDAVFIGGSGGRLSEIMSYIAELAGTEKKKIRTVLSAVTLETVNSALSVFKELNASSTKCVQVSVSRVKEAGSYHMLMAQNPVFIISGVLE